VRVSAAPVVVPLSSTDVLRYPFLFLTGHLPVRFTESERANLRAFIDRGGFLFVDDHNHDIDGVFTRRRRKSCVVRAARWRTCRTTTSCIRRCFGFPTVRRPRAMTQRLGDNLVHRVSRR